MKAHHVLELQRCVPILQSGTVGNLGSLLLKLETTGYSSVF